MPSLPDALHILLCRHGCHSVQAGQHSGDESASVKIIGLTGGIGMGKSTCAAQFRRARMPVFDADLAVHRLQGPGGRALRPIEAAFPGTVRENRLDRSALRAAVLGKPDALLVLERIVHPMVRDEERRFLARAHRVGARAVVLDIPLLLETPDLDRVDLIVVVSAPRAVQIHRVGRRRKMDRAQIEAIIARQMPDAQKRRMANVVIRTGLSRFHTIRALKRVIARILA